MPPTPQVTSNDSTTDPSSKQSAGPNVGVIVGSTIGGVVLALILAAIIVPLARRYRRSHKAVESSTSSRSSERSLHYRRRLQPDVAEAPLLHVPFITDQESPYFNPYEPEGGLTGFLSSDAGFDGESDMQGHTSSNDDCTPFMVESTKPSWKSSQSRNSTHHSTKSIATLKTLDSPTTALDSPTSQYSLPSASTHMHSVIAGPPPPVPPVPSIPLHLRSEIDPEPSPQLEAREVIAVSHLLQSRARRGKATSVDAGLNRVFTHVSKIERSDSINSHFYDDVAKPPSAASSLRRPRPLPPLPSKSLRAPLESVTEANSAASGASFPTNSTYAPTLPITPYSPLDIPQNLTSAFQTSVTGSSASLTTNSSPMSRHLSITPFESELAYPTPVSSGPHSPIVPPKSPSRADQRRVNLRIDTALSNKKPASRPS